nr:HTH domain-containing protein [bacterium]
MKGRNSQVVRIYKLITILEGAPHGLSISDLTTRLNDRGFEVDKRTIYRDLDALKAAGFPLEERGKTEDQGTRWTLERSIKVSKALVLNARELLALYLARSALIPLKETPFFTDL